MRKVAHPKASPRRAGDLGRTQNVFRITSHALRKGVLFQPSSELVIVPSYCAPRKVLLIHYNLVRRVGEC